MTSCTNIVSRFALLSPFSDVLSTKSGAIAGHVLIIPKQVVKRFADLTSEQVTDLWLTAQKVGSQLENHFEASSLTYAIQVSTVQEKGECQL